MAVPEFQNHENTVWSAVRVPLETLPIVLVSLKSFAYWALPNGGGPAGRNSDGASITQGTIVANWGTAPGANAGGVGRQSPTVVAPRNGGGAGVNPSAPRHARIPFATAWPHVTPLATAALDA